VSSTGHEDIWTTKKGFITTGTGDVLGRATASNISTTNAQSGGEVTSEKVNL